MPDLDPALVAAHSELLVTILLQHVLGITRHALAIAHPELRDDEPRARDDSTRVALKLARHILELDDLLQCYRRAVETEYNAYDHDDHLPF